MGRFKVNMSEIDPQLRPFGRIYRFVFPYNTERTFRFQNVALDLLIKGRWFSRTTRVKKMYIERPDGSRMRILICRSRKAGKGDSSPKTGLLWIHGGGYAIGLPEQEVGFMKMLCSDGNCIAVLPDYIRSTKRPYPAALGDCHTALAWMHSHAKELGINPSQVFVGGDSAGGGLTAALSLYERDEGHLPIAFQMPLYPMIDDRQVTKSSQDNDAPVWNTRSNSSAWKLYLGHLCDSDVVPAHAAPSRETDFSGLPPTLTYVGDVEPFRDETLTYVKALEEAGVPVHFRLFKGCYHGFDIMVPKAEVSRQARAFLVETFRFAQKTYFCPGSGSDH